MLFVDWGVAEKSLSDVLSKEALERVAFGESLGRGWRYFEQGRLRALAALTGGLRLTTQDNAPLALASLPISQTVLPQIRTQCRSLSGRFQT